MLLIEGLVTNQARKSFTKGFYTTALIASFSKYLKTGNTILLQGHDKTDSITILEQYMLNHE